MLFQRRMKALLQRFIKKAGCEDSPPQWSGHGCSTEGRSRAEEIIARARDEW
jgi:hypothetical protein